MTVINRKEKGKIKYYELTPGGFKIEIDKDEYNEKLKGQISKWKSEYKSKAKGGAVKGYKNGGECRGGGAATKGKKFQGVF